jgi:hypothetical protein
MQLLTALTIFTFSIIGNENKHYECDEFKSRYQDKIHQLFVSQPDTARPAAKSKPVNKYFPFEIMDMGGHYQIAVQLDAPGLSPKYQDFFKTYEYSGNGYCWEGHITQILEKLDKELLKHIEFNSEGGAFLATADSKANQIKFVELLSPVFSDLKKLGLWVKKADRSRISD